MNFFIKFSLYFIVFISSDLNAIEYQAVPKVAIYPGCLFSDSGTGDKNKLGLRELCQRELSVKAEKEDSPLGLELSSSLLHGSPQESKDGGDVSNLYLYATALSTTYKWQLDRPRWLNFGAKVGIFHGKAHYLTGPYLDQENHRFGATGLKFGISLNVEFRKIVTGLQIDFLYAPQSDHAGSSYIALMSLWEIPTPYIGMVLRF